MPKAGSEPIDELAMHYVRPQEHGTRGVGTALLGPDTRPAHRLAGTRYSWQWRLRLETQEV